MENAWLVAVRARIAPFALPPKDTAIVESPVGPPSASRTLLVPHVFPPSPVRATLMASPSTAAAIPLPSSPKKAARTGPAGNGGAAFANVAPPSRVTSNASGVSTQPKVGVTSAASSGAGPLIVVVPADACWPVPHADSARRPNPASTKEILVFMSHTSRTGAQGVGSRVDGTVRTITVDVERHAVPGFQVVSPVLLVPLVERPVAGRYARHGVGVAVAGPVGAVDELRHVGDPGIRREPGGAGRAVDAGALGRRYPHLVRPPADEALRGGETGPPAGVEPLPVVDERRGHGVPAERAEPLARP